MNSQELLQGYDLQKLTTGALGGHSALDVCAGAKKAGFRTVVVAQEGREKTYGKYFRTRGPAPSLDFPSDQPDRIVLAGRGRAGARDKLRQGEVGCVDEVIVVKKFEDVLKQEMQKQLRAMNTVFISSRYFWVYFKDFAKIENEFHVPIFGNRSYVKLEERGSTGLTTGDQPTNQYDLLKAANIRTPKIFKPQDIQKGLIVIVKAHEAQRGYERAFFLASSREEYSEIATKKIEAGQITREGLEKAVIEEFIVGAPVNFNFFYSVLNGELELMGTDTRRQTNLDGFLRMTGDEQREALKRVPLKMIETGHIAVTVKESLLEKAFDLGERFVKATKEVLGREIIGPFALQGVVVAEEGKEDIVIFDVSLRIPGSPGTRFTPYSGYLYGESMSYGERIAMEIREAVKQERLEKIVT